MSRKSHAQLDREIAEALRGTTARPHHATRYQQSKAGSSYGGAQWPPHEKTDTAFPGVRSMEGYKPVAPRDASEIVERLTAQERKALTTAFGGWREGVKLNESTGRETREGLLRYGLVKGANWDEVTPLGREVTDLLRIPRSDSSKRSHATTKTIAASVHHDRLATAIARVVRDPHYWRGGSFDINEAMQVLPKLQGTYDWQRVLDWVDDYLQSVSGVAGATGEGIPERATRGVGGHEVKAAQAMIQRLRRAGSSTKTSKTRSAHATKKPSKITVEDGDDRATASRTATDDDGWVVEVSDGHEKQKRFYSDSGGAWLLQKNGTLGRQLRGTKDERAPKDTGKMRSFLRSHVLGTL